MHRYNITLIVPQTQSFAFDADVAIIFNLLESIQLQEEHTEGRNRQT